MSILSVCERRWFTKILTKNAGTPIRNRMARRPMLERLEDRTLPTATLPNELLVQFRPGVDDAARAEVRGVAQVALADAIHTEAMIDVHQGVMERIVLPEGVSMESALEKLRSNPNVLYAEPNALLQSGFVSNDPYYTTSGQLWGMYSDDVPSAVGPGSTTNQYGSQAEEAWNAGYIGSRSVIVGIIDEGFQFTHPDLAANVWTNPFDAVDGIDNDGNGYIDDIHGWDFFNDDNTVYDGTGDDHGTHVAGTIGAAGGNALGVAGVNWEVTMISTKFLGPTGGYTDDAVRALDYLTDMKVRHPSVNIVASNNSWGGGGFSQALLDAITRAANQGILFIAAAGNSNSNNDAVANYPSNYSTTAGAGYEAVIAVASITSTGTRSSFSSYGATTVDIGAPGSSINSTLPTDSYGAYSGTSMATPHVTGAAALYAAAHPSATANDIRNALLSSATPTASLAGITVTGGRLNISAALGVVTLPSLTINNVTVTEGNSGTTAAVFTVTLSAAPTQTITVNFTTANGTASDSSDYALASGAVTFNPGDPTTKTITVAVNGDTTSEANETFFVNLSGATNATIADNQGQGTISNDDAAPGLSLAINNASLVEGNRGKKNMQFTISLSAPATQTVTVNYATANGSATAGSDYRAVSSSVTFSAGQSSKTINVSVNGDRTAEPDETFVVNLSNATGATIADSQGTGTIVNDDGGGSGSDFHATVSALASYAGALPSASLDISSVLADATTGRKNADVITLETAKDSSVKGAPQAAEAQGTRANDAIAGAPTSHQLDVAAVDVLFADLAKVFTTIP